MVINGINNFASSLLINQLNQTNAELFNSFNRLSTGKAINSAADNAAGLAIATQLEAQARALSQAQGNAQLGVSLTQTADGYLGSVTDDVQRIRELSVQAANGTLNDGDRAAIQAEINQLSESIDYTLSSAEFNSQKIFDGSTRTFQIGTSESGNIQSTFANLTAESLGVANIDVTTVDGAQNAISQSESALQTVNQSRVEIGALQNRFESAISSLQQTEIDTLSSLSQIQDVNIAEEILNLSKLQTQHQAQLAVAAQINRLNENVLPLLLGN